MSIVVTGGAGYIGSHMVLALIEAGENVIVLDDLSTGFKWAVHPAAKLIRGSIGDQSTLVALWAHNHFNEPIEAIIHFAGSIIVPQSITDPLAYYLNNTVNSRNLIENAIRAHIPYFIFSSTAAVYGASTSQPIVETDQTQPISPYGRSKLMTEWMLEDTYKAHGLHYVVLRYFNVAGADPKGRSGQSSPIATHLIKIACQTALGLRDSIEVFGNDYKTQDGTCQRDYIHISDLITAHMNTLYYLRNKGASTVFNCGYGTAHSVYDIIAAVERAHGSQLKIKISPRRPGDPAILIADAQKIRQTLNWQPQFAHLDDIVTSALAWEKHLLATGISDCY